MRVVRPGEHALEGTHQERLLHERVVRHGLRGGSGPRARATFRPHRIVGRRPRAEAERTSRAAGEQIGANRYLYRKTPSRVPAKIRGALASKDGGRFRLVT